MTKRDIWSIFDPPSLQTLAGDLIEIFGRKLTELFSTVYVDFGHGNSVIAYVQHHGTSEGALAYLPNDRYTTTDPAAATLPTSLSNRYCLNISGSFDPIHVNPYFSDFASVPGTVAKGRPE